MSSSPDDKASASMSYSKITRIVLTIAILLDFLVISGLSFYSIIKSNEAEIANNEGLIEDSSLRTLIVTSDGVIYSAWVERTAEESKIVFGKSTDFGKSWKQDVALNVSNVGIQATEKRFDDISLMIDRSGFAHITFMKNLRSPSAYGDAYLWTLSYITNKGGNWSAPEEVKVRGTATSKRVLAS